jgi:hypothetical protein
LRRCRRRRRGRRPDFSSLVSYANRALLRPQRRSSAPARHVSKLRRVRNLRRVPNRRRALNLRTLAPPMLVAVAAAEAC